jgi:hypothetical protein
MEDEIREVSTFLVQLVQKLQKRDHEAGVEMWRTPGQIHSRECRRKVHATLDWTLLIDMPYGGMGQIENNTVGCHASRHFSSRCKSLCI